MTFCSKRRRVAAIASILLVLAASIAGLGGCDGDGYTPPSKDLEIRDWYDLDAVRDNLAGHHILMNNLNSTTAGYRDLAGPTADQRKGWNPIGDFYPFTGSLDGQGYEITDLFINRPVLDDIGLFRYVYPGGIIENLGLVNADVTGDSVAHAESNVGSLVGANFGTVNNCYSTGSVTGGRYVGGLVGVNGGTLSNSYCSGTVNGNASVGGLVGYNRHGTVSNSHYDYNEVLISGETMITIGALVDEDFHEWLTNDKFLDINDRLFQGDGYYMVNNMTDFKQLLPFGQDTTLKFRLTQDLDLGDEPNFYIPYLAGEFDGSGHRISNLSLNFGFLCGVGLFGYITASGNVTDLAAENVNIIGADDVGGLVGYSRGTIGNSYSSGSVSGASRVGGLVGWNDEGDVSDSSFNGTVTGSAMVGGLAGRNSDSNVSNSYSTGNVTATSWVGGLVGYNWKGTVGNSYCTGNVTGADWVGGLVGYNWKGTVGNSYCTGTTVGGIIAGYWGTGGLAGGNTGTITDCYSTGSVSCDELVGGLLGLNANDGTVGRCYSTGSVTGSERVGGLVGDNIGGTVSDSFWDVETSGQAISNGGTGKTTAEMQHVATFSGAMWNILTVASPAIRNISYIWNIVDGEAYPFLSWQP
jgi:hypothetical protein